MSFQERSGLQALGAKRQTGCQERGLETSYVRRKGFTHLAALDIVR